MAEISPQEAELIAHAEIGDAARKFMESELGQCVLGMANQELEAAKQAFLRVDPEDSKLIRKLQDDARVAIYFEQWLKELISKGDEALEVYRHGKES